MVNFDIRLQPPPVASDESKFSTTGVARRYRVVCGLVVALAANLQACRSRTNETSARPPSPSESQPIAEAPPRTDASTESPVPSSEFVEQLKVAGLDVLETRQFLDTLKTRIVQRDGLGVCALVSFPLDTRSKRHGQKIGTEASCRRLYDRIFTAPVREAIIKQRLEDLAASSNGVMVGDGEVWFAVICAEPGCQHRAIKIISLNN